MSTSTTTISTLALIAVLMSGCQTGDDTAGTDAGTETGTDAGTDTGGEADTIELAMSLKEFGSGDPIAGASVAVDGATYTTGSLGEATVALASSATSRIGVTQAGFPDYAIYVTTLEADFSDNYYVSSDAALEALGAALQIQRDPTKGLLSVGVLDGVPGDDAPLAGVQISIDATSESQLVFDASAGAGFSLGDTTLAGSSSASIFVNVAPGTVTPTLTPPAGYTCDLGPQTVEVVANGYTIVNYYCHP